MAIRPLKELDDCQLVDPDQDCRGWPVVDAAGNRVGTVGEMLVDTDAARVTSLVLDRGDVIPVGSVALRDKKVQVMTPPARRPADRAVASGREEAFEERTDVGVADKDRSPRRS